MGWAPIRMPAVVAVVAGVAAGVSGCAGQRVCAGPSVPAPYVMLDASAWERGHPGETLRACAATSCLKAPADQSGPLPVPVTGAPDRTVTLSVTGYRHGRRVLGTSRSVHLAHRVEHGPCGTVGWWQLSVRLTAAGALVPA